MPGPAWSVWLVVAAIAVMTAATPASAKSARGKSAKSALGKRIAIMGAEEKDAADAPVRAQIAKALKKHKIKVVGKPKGTQPADDQAWAALGRKLKVDGFVTSSFDGSKGKRHVEIAVRTAAGGAVVGSETFSAKGAPKKLATAVGSGFWKQLGSSVEQVSAPKAGEEGSGMPARDLAHEPEAAADKKPATEPDDEPSGEATKPARSNAAASSDKSDKGDKKDEAAEDVKPAADDEKDDDDKAPAAAASARDKDHHDGDGAPDGLGPKTPALSALLALRFVSRSFVYTANPALPNSATSSPTIGGEVRWFPLVNLGLELGGEFASWLKYLGKYPTVTSDLYASLVFRLPMSFGQITAHAGGFRHFTAVTDDGTNTRADQLLPDVVYLGARVGAGVMWRATNAFSVAAQGSYRLITNMSGGAYGVTTNPYFPKAVPGPGFDVALTLGYRITPMLQIQAGFDIRHYVLAVRGGTDTRINATYATDQSLGGWLGLAGTFGGK